MPPPRPLPTIATLQTLVEATLREVRGARLDIDTIRTDAKTIRTKVLETEEIIRISRLPSLSSVTPTPPSARPSMAVAAAKKGLNLGKNTAIVIGLLSLVAQVVAQFQPRYSGPLTAILKVLGVDP